MKIRLRSRFALSVPPGSSVGRSPDSRSRGLGFETLSGHLMVGPDPIQAVPSEGRGAVATTLLLEHSFLIALKRGTDRSMCEK